METKCTICRKDMDEVICETCLAFLEEKYPNKKELEHILQWHKNQTKELNKED